MSYTVKVVADLAGVSVRTLHHYDQIGLLKPEAVSPAGYRLYSDDDLEKLQQVLFFTELGFSLQETRGFVDSPGFDRKMALLKHKELLVEKKNRLERIITAVEKTIRSIEGDAEVSKNDMFDAFDMTEIEKHKEKYAEETRQKYGNTDAYRKSEKKTARYTKEDWAAISAKSGEIYGRFVSLMDRDPADPDVQKAAADWRQLISHSFYNCTLEIFRGLGDLYVSDERFTANIDKYKPGLAQFMRAAMHAYCDSKEGKA